MDKTQTSQSLGEFISEEAIGHKHEKQNHRNGQSETSDATELNSVKDRMRCSP